MRNPSQKGLSLGLEREKRRKRSLRKREGEDVAPTMDAIDEGDKTAPLFYER